MQNLLACLEELCWCMSRVDGAAIFSTAVSYTRKMFMKLTTGGHSLHERLQRYLPRSNIEFLLKGMINYN
jgi:hypothetical protein